MKKEKFKVEVFYMTGRTKAWVYHAYDESLIKANDYFRMPNVCRVKVWYDVPKKKRLLSDLLHELIK